MSESTPQAEWYYVGQYGELGPLSLDQMKDLIRDKVVDGDTYVWKVGMTDWVQASGVSELRSRIVAGMTTPPPPPTKAQPRPQAPSTNAPPAPAAASYPAPATAPAYRYNYEYSYAPRPAEVDWSALEATLPKSDKSRLVAGLLSLIPGVGRLYLGYSAHGALQMVTFVFCGVGLLWSWIDCFYILLGGVKYDGYGRVLQD